MISCPVQKIYQKSKEFAFYSYKIFRLDKDDMNYLKTLKVKPYEELQVLSEVD